VRQCKEQEIKKRLRVHRGQTERLSFRELVLPARLRSALDKLNSSLPAEALQQLGAGVVARTCARGQRDFIVAVPDGPARGRRPALGARRRPTSSNRGRRRRPCRRIGDEVADVVPPRFIVLYMATWRPTLLLLEQ
jgi:hypothetical protein